VGVPWLSLQKQKPLEFRLLANYPAVAARITGEKGRTACLDGDAALVLGGPSTILMPGRERKPSPSVARIAFGAAFLCRAELSTLAYGPVSDPRAIRGQARFPSPAEAANVQSVRRYTGRRPAPWIVCAGRATPSVFLDHSGGA